MLFFENPTIVELLKTQFVPVTMNIDMRKTQNDAEGTFYRKIVEPSPRDLDRETSQGIYVVTPDGALLHFFHTQLTTPQQMIRALNSALENYKPTQVAAIPEGTRLHHENLNKTPPKGGFVVRVGSKFPGAQPQKRFIDVKWREKFGAVGGEVGRDVLWVRADENMALQRGEFPKSLLTRIVRFHLVDAVFSPGMKWEPEEILKMDWTFRGGKLQATISLSRANKVWRHSADLIGHVTFEGARVTRFDLVSKGILHTGKSHSLVAGEYPLEIAFSLATGDDPADRIPPINLRGDHPIYLR